MKRKKEMREKERNYFILPLKYNKLVFIYNLTTPKHKQDSREKFIHFGPAI